MRCSCGRTIIPCMQAAAGHTCEVRCLHERPRRPSTKRPCAGWTHLDGWHICDPSVTHAVMASPAKE